MVAEACTWVHPMGLWAQEAEDCRSAQILVQVGRREEGVGSQAHSQEAPDQGGAETTFKRERETQSKAQRSENEPVGGVSAAERPLAQQTATGPQGAFWAQDLALRSFLASPLKKTLQPWVAWL